MAVNTSSKAGDLLVLGGVLLAGIYVVGQVTTPGTGLQKVLDPQGKLAGGNTTSTTSTSGVPVSNTQQQQAQPTACNGWTRPLTTAELATTGEPSGTTIRQLFMGTNPGLSEAAAMAVWKSQGGVC